MCTFGDGFSGKFFEKILMDTILSNQIAALVNSKRSLPKTRGILKNTVPMLCGFQL